MRAELRIPTITEVIIARHGTGTHMGRPDLVSGRVHNASLTDYGHIEAAALGEELAAENPYF